MIALFLALVAQGDLVEKAVREEDKDKRAALVAQLRKFDVAAVEKALRSPSRGPSPVEFGKVVERTAKSDLDGLRSHCAPGCSNDAVDTVDRKILVSHVALGAGATALVGAALAYFYPRLAESTPKTTGAYRAWNTF